MLSQNSNTRKDRQEEHTFQKCCQIERYNPVDRNKCELVNITIPTKKHSSLLMLYIQKYSS